MRPTLGIRRRISQRIGRLIDWRIDHRIPPEQLAGYARQLEGNARQLAGNVRQLDEYGHRLADGQRRLEALERRLGEVQNDLGWVRNELDRVIPQVASQEWQLEALREHLAAVPAADSAQIHQARSLIDEIRREHAQIRVRLTGIARYEVRLRRLEDRADGHHFSERSDGVDDPVDVANGEIRKQR